VEQDCGWVTCTTIGGEPSGMTPYCHATADQVFADGRCVVVALGQLGATVACMALTRSRMSGACSVDLDLATRHRNLIRR